MNIDMNHFKMLNSLGLDDNLNYAGCGSCQASCQSACKITCVVANQECENEKIKNDSQI